MTVRQAAVAGMFYPGTSLELQVMVQKMLADNPAPSLVTEQPRALIVPHAGYPFSGSVAAIAYNSLSKHADSIRRVVLLGPSHRVAFHGIALTEADSFQTPLGHVCIDQQSVQALSRLPQVAFLDQAHELEHSLEVQLPFLQNVLGDFVLVPLVVGDASASQVEEVITPFVEDENTLIVISTDLSHYLPYFQAQEKDRATIAAIESFATNLQGDQACGCRALNGFLSLAREQNWQLQLLDYRNSGDAGAGRDGVVGYAAFIAR